MFRSLVCFLKKYLPADRAVTVRRTRLPADEQGDCLQSTGCYKIRVDRRLNEAHQIDVLLHEYGHTLAYEPEHGVAWGKAYARVYRTYLQWLEWRSGTPAAAVYRPVRRVGHRNGSHRLRKRPS